jgi:hypothetical protein
MLNTTRLFFERTSKMSQSFQAFGNVYRNSKWSDLHVFNIKASAGLQFKHIFIILISSILVTFFLTRFELQWFHLLVFTVGEFIGFLKDTLSSWIYFIIYTTSFIFLKIIYFLSKKFHMSLVPSVTKKSATDAAILGNRQTTWLQAKGTGTPATANEILILSLYLQKVVKYLHLTNITDMQISRLYSTEHDFTRLYHSLQINRTYTNHFLFFVLNQKYNLVTKTMNNRFSSRDHLFYEPLDNSTLNNIRTLEVNTNWIKSLTFKHQKEFLKIINQNLNIGKENRWLMKHSLLSHDVLKSAHSTTHLKKLYGTDMVSSSLASKNIWVSNRLNSGQTLYNNALTSSMSSLKNISNSLLHTSASLNLNNLEESFFWLLQRFNFLQTSKSYYQFEQSSLKASLVNALEKQKRLRQSKANLTFFREASAFNTINANTYNAHFLLTEYAKGSREFSKDQDLQLYTQTVFALTSFDLNFSKYLLNNISLQKNELLIYSNL